MEYWKTLEVEDKLDAAFHEQKVRKELKCMEAKRP